jgi:hypothetical protein
MAEKCEAPSRPKTIKAMLRSWWFWKTALGVLLGAIGGYLYYHFVGCSSGTCAITGSPYGSAGFGALLGFFVTNSPCSSCNSSKP